MNDELYSDVIRNITVSGSVVRIDFASMAVDKTNDEGVPLLDHRQRVVMPLDGFVRSYEEILKIISHLEEQGVISKRDGENADGDGVTTIDGK